MCNEAADHWTFNPLITSSADTIVIGMFHATASTGRWYPTACKKSGADWIAWAADGHPGFTTNALQEDASVCTAGGSDTVSVLPFGSKHNCTLLGGTIVLEGFDDNNRSLTITGSDGNDSLSVSGWTGEANLCGGPGADKLFGGGMTQFLSGGSGNDGLDGASNTDTLRGGTGHDVLRHTSSGADLLRGDADNDCVDLATILFSSASSCDAGSDRHGYPFVDCGEASCVAPPTSCQGEMPFMTSCCTLSGRTCPMP